MRHASCSTGSRRPPIRCCRRAVKAAEAAGGEAIEVNREILAKISRRDNPQTVLAVFDQAFAPLSALDPRSAASWVALEAVRDPGNLGTIVRTADAAGCGGVVLVGECCDPTGGGRARDDGLDLRREDRPRERCRSSSPGAAELVQVCGRRNAAHRHDRLPRRRATRPPTLIVMGNEQAGLTPDLAAMCDVAVKIPMRGRADSLNLAVATAIMIYAATE